MILTPTVYPITVAMQILIKKLYSYIKSKNVDNVGVCPIRDQGSICTDKKEKARISKFSF